MAPRRSNGFWARRAGGRLRRHSRLGQSAAEPQKRPKGAANRAKAALSAGAKLIEAHVPRAAKAVLDPAALNMVEARNAIANVLDHRSLAEMRALSVPAELAEM